MNEIDNVCTGKMIEDAIPNRMDCLSFFSPFLRFFREFGWGIMKCNPPFIVLFILFRIE